VLLAHVVTTPSFGQAFGYGYDGQHSARADVAERVIEEARALANEMGVRVEPVVRSGVSAAEEILQLARESHADLLVLAANLRQFTGRPFLGTASEYLLEEAEATVVVVTSPPGWGYRPARGAHSPAPSCASGGSPDADNVLDARARARGPVLHVWLARPARRNALNGAALEEIEALFTQLQTDFATRVVVLGGRGPSFCAAPTATTRPAASACGAARAPANASGATPRSSGGAPARRSRRSRQSRSRGCTGTCSVEASRSPSPATSGSRREGARLALPEVDLGVPLTWGATPRLIHEIGAARARELLLLGDAVDAERAERIGLVHRVLPADGWTPPCASWPAGSGQARDRGAHDEDAASRLRAAGGARRRQRSGLRPAARFVPGRRRAEAFRRRE